MKMRTLARSVAVSLFAVAISGHVAAQLNRSPLRNTPVQQFNDEDMRLFKAAWNKALDETPELGTVSWENPATKSHGDITVASIFTWQKHPCRRIRIVSEAQGTKGDSTMNLCRVNEKWRAVSPSQLQGQ